MMILGDANYYAAPCPRCGELPTGVPLTCPNCYDPNPDCSDVERLQGQNVREWIDRVQECLDGFTGAELRDSLAMLDSRVDVGTGVASHRAMARYIRDELTRRHHACLETIPPSPRLPREERETARPGR